MDGEAALVTGDENERWAASVARRSQPAGYPLGQAGLAGPQRSSKQIDVAGSGCLAYNFSDRAGLVGSLGMDCDARGHEPVHCGATRR